MSPIALLLPVGLLIAILRIARPAPPRPIGHHVLTFSLPLLARARLHAVPAFLLLFLALVLVAADAAPPWTMVAVLVALTALLAWPVAYELTTDGIHLGRTGQRRWVEFAGVVRAPGSVRLQAGAGGRGYRIWLSGSRGDDEFIYLLRQLIKGAYQGRDVPVRTANGSARAQGSNAVAMFDADRQPVLSGERESR